MHRLPMHPCAHIVISRVTFHHRRACCTLTSMSKFEYQAHNSCDTIRENGRPASILHALQPPLLWQADWTRPNCTGAHLEQ
mmetsp:Transcript_20236/g.48564  ORF Transcript_20236/g.48564 Transcript_20236/m.48564 type:complete len:81 (-) Transcript_20236:887-1129(-)